MKKYHHYVFESPKWTKRRQVKHRCPRCGRKSLVRYIDLNNGCRYVDDTVGKCDHENSCHYHLTPWEYYDDHPWLKKPAWSYISTVVKKPQPVPLTELIQPLPSSEVKKYLSPASTFWQWMTGACKEKLQLNETDLTRVYEDYQIGTTCESDVVFWQMTEEGDVRTGHIMQYGPDGHRLSYQNWQHAILKNGGQLPNTWQLHQCLFGQHLLKKYPDKPIYLVESEKTAVILACLQSDHVCLATSGSGGLSTEKLACLKGRRVEVIPDSGCYEKWCNVLHNTQGIDYVVTDQMEAYQPNTDLADILLGEAKLRNQP